MVITNTDFQNIAYAISGYTDEMYTEAKRLVGTGVVSTDQRIDVSGENFTGQFRWYSPLNPNVNTPSLTNEAPGNYTDINTQYATFVKSARTFGSQQVNLQEVVSKQDGLAKIARDFAEVRAQDDDQALRALFAGVLGRELTYVQGSNAHAGGIETFEHTADNSRGFYVDINKAGAFGAEAQATTARKLIDANGIGAARGERLFRAMGMAFGDYEPDYVYMVTSPEVLSELRAANLVDDTTITEGNIEFTTIFGGKFRLILTRSMVGNSTINAALGLGSAKNAQSDKVTFLVKPGSVAFAQMNVPTPVEIERHAAAYTGGGSTEIWYRWGYAMHPMGYNWVRSGTNAFADHTQYADRSNWGRIDESILNLGILPILHS